jgi:hypothetical protein
MEKMSEITALLEEYPAGHSGECNRMHGRSLLAMHTTDLVRMLPFQASLIASTVACTRRCSLKVNADGLCVLTTQLH